MASLRSRNRIATVKYRRKKKTQFEAMVAEIKKQRHVVEELTKKTRLLKDQIVLLGDLLQKMNMDKVISTRDQRMVSKIAKLEE